MWKLHRKLNFPNIFRLAAIYTWAPAFKDVSVCCIIGSQQEGARDQEDSQPFCPGHGGTAPVSRHPRGQGVRNHQVSLTHPLLALNTHTHAHTDVGFVTDNMRPMSVIFFVFTTFWRQSPLPVTLIFMLYFDLSVMTSSPCPTARGRPSW